MIRKLLIEPDRRRKLPQSFSWVDQRPGSLWNHLNYR